MVASGNHVQETESRSGSLMRHSSVVGDHSRALVRERQRVDVERETQNNKSARSTEETKSCSPFCSRPTLSVTTQSPSQFLEPFQT